MGGHSVIKLLTTKEFFKREFNFTKPEEGRSGTVLECATKNNVAYIAYQSVTPEKTEVIALVGLLRHSPTDPDGLTFGYKDISEDMGPTASECPAKILKLLTKTTNQLSLEWRARCWENIEKKKKNPKVNPEDWIQFSSPITSRSGNPTMYSNGCEETTLLGDVTYSASPDGAAWNIPTWVPSHLSMH